ncbi:NAD(P)-binding protein [Desulfoglaeba alkanexedens]|uniref:4Fe-4S dicluster domain-containing protein n=1 Tax=Desulfoglaeba alkanexedens ALDC TaxID=980445 RepID=A0A4P8L433_9BACT|nr:NAD(P)-binding protein [Desulfoglaeba alkanexedens]QCQ22483.1 4Fe-4S dicluster domain-containing protein [Desulfoglaeba alkanexedens ALDC]
MSEPSSNTPLVIDIATFPGKPLDEVLAVREALLRSVKEHGHDQLAPVRVRLVGWRGIEGKDVMLTVRQGPVAALYQLVTPDMVPKIIERHLREARPLEEWLAGKPFRSFYEPQKIVVTQFVGTLDPTSLQEYLDQDGYAGVDHFVREGFDALLDRVKNAGILDVSRLDGRPLAPVWREARHSGAFSTLVVQGCLPATTVTGDLLLVEGCPHQLIEGAILAAALVKARHVVVLVPARAHLARERLEHAWTDLQESEITFPREVLPETFRVISTEKAFLLEDEALVRAFLQSSLADADRRKIASGKFLCHSVETLAVLPVIAQQALYGFGSPGTPSNGVTRIFRLSGPLRNPGFAEMPLTASVFDAVETVGGGLQPGRKPKAFQAGGPLGGLFPYEMIQLPLDHATIRELGGAMAVGTIEVLDERTCIVSKVRKDLSYVLNQPGAHCPTCYRALCEIRDLLDAVIDGRGDARTLERLRAACETLKKQADCVFGREAVNPVWTSLQFFSTEYRMHTENRHCLARVCPKLLPAPCQMACPTSIDIPSYLAHLAQGRFKEALEIIRLDNPFPWVCGLICPHPCERACVRANLDDPINIKYLKAYVAERAEEAGAYRPHQPAPSQGRKVAVVGSGPAGLAAAHYLALMGYGVTIFEALPIPGGLLMTGIPEYRLPRKVVEKEIAMILALGVEIRTGITVGRDVTIDELREDGFEAFFLGIGAHQGYKLKIEGETDFPQVYDAIAFLREVNLGDRRRPGDRVVVVGGGNAAMDAARTSVRLGCREVHVAYRRTRDQMPAHHEEIAQAMEEGVRFHFLAVPLRVGGEDGRVTYLECLKARLGKPDASGRRRPIPVAGSEFKIEVDAVITAIGQQPDLTHFGEAIPVQVTARNLIVTDPYTTCTNVADIFAGGDAVTGPATVVEAIAAGKQAALDIDYMLSGRSGPPPIFRAHRRDRVPFAPISAEEKVTARRPTMPLVPAEERRRNFNPVELGYNEEQARQEAMRCLRCDVCIRCGACERVCRDQMKVHALQFSPISTTERILTDYPRVAERCIACGACALVCPTGAIECIEDNEKREIRLCGTVLNRLPVIRCASCGGAFVPDRYLEYVTSRSDQVMEKSVFRKLCPKCARAKRAELFVKL